MVKYAQQNRSSQTQVENRKTLYDLFENRPLPTDELLINLGLFIRSGALAKILWIQELYEQVLHIPGAMMEFGVWCDPAGRRQAHRHARKTLARFAGGSGESPCPRSGLNLT